MQGLIPQDLLKCLELREIDLSQNNFEGTIPLSLGLLSNLTRIHLNENKITGTIPANIFNLQQIEELMLQSNKLTGSIPIQVGNLIYMKKLVLSHNRLKGNIPEVIENLDRLETLHLHHNQLTGNAPFFDTDKMTSYITDCGFPSYSLPNHLDCTACTMCCNSDGACQEVKNNRSIWRLALQVASFTVIGCLILLITKFISSIRKPSFEVENVHLSEIYTETSVHSFIFAEGYTPKLIYFLSICLQFALFSVYLLASDINKEETDWKFTYQCPDNSIDCVNLKRANEFGWLLFTLVIICFIGTDVVMSVKQMYQGILRRDPAIGFSGLVLLFLTIVAMYSSFMYNRALAEKNTDLILNAVVLIFIMDLDDEMHSICKKLFPKWTDKIEEDISKKISTN